MNVSYTIYPGVFDPAPGRGYRPAMVRLTMPPPPTPVLTANELRQLIEQLEQIADEMQTAESVTA